MKLKILLFISLFTFHLSLLATPVSAHVLVTDGNIGATMHIDPDDDPIVGSPASFFFDFKDRTNKFNPANCNCTFSILENNQQLFTQSLFQNSSIPSLDNASASYTFPQKDVYQIVVSGSPLTPEAFQNFKLKYDVRVDRENNQAAVATQPGSWLSTHVIHLAGALLLSLFLVGALIKQYIAKSKQQLPLNQKSPISKNVK